MTRASGLPVLLLLFLTGCRAHSQAENVKLHCDISPAPPRVGPAVVTLTLASASGAPVNDAKLEIEADMAHPGMAPVFATVRPTGLGHYTSALDFTMPGDWVLIVRGLLPGGVRWERQVPVSGVVAP